MIIAFAISMLLCALIPAVLFVLNLKLYREPAPVTGAALPGVSILIPARNEAANIAPALRAALATRDIVVEIVVMDDGSTDGTDDIVLTQSAEDARVRLERAPALPAGWNGKQHACWGLAHAARMPILCFVDADVRLTADCVARMAQFLERGHNGLVSGFPRQVTGTTLEWLLLPLIHFVLLGFLPMAKMRRGTDPAFAAGCGQFLMVRREAYFASGGHSRIRQTMHDGLLLPRLFRAAGFRTDLADLTHLASCRMYTSAAEVWSGLAKNATEGIAAPARIVPVSIALLLGQVLPFVTVPYVALLLGYMFLLGISTPLVAWALLGVVPISILAAWLPRAAAARRFQQDWRSALLHPVGVLLLVVIQWYALFRKIRGGSVSWRGRAYVGE